MRVYMYYVTMHIKYTRTQTYLEEFACSAGARGKHSLEELKGTRQVATLDAGIQQAVVDLGVGFRGLGVRTQG